MPEQYVVPQFLTVEPKIIGAITMRQFLWVIGDALIVTLMWKLLTLPFFIPSAIVVVGVGALFAFYKVNGQTFQYFLINIIQTKKRPRVRVWGKEYTDAELKIFMTEKPSVTATVVMRKIKPASSRLAQLSLVVNTGGAFSGNEEAGAEYAISQARLKK